RPAASELQNAGLGRRVDSLPWLHDQRTDRREQHDAALSLWNHDPSRSSQHVEVADDVDVEDTFDLAREVIEHPLAHVDARRGDDDVQMPVFRVDLRHRPFDRCRVSYVESTSRRGSPDLLRHCFRNVGLDVETYDRGAHRRRSARYSFTDAGCATNDCSDLAGEIEDVVTDHDYSLLHE